MQKRCGVKFALYGHYIVTLDALESWNYFAIYLELNIAWRWVWWDIMKINYQINDVARRDPDQKYSNNAFFYTSNIKIDAVPNFHMHAFSLLKVKSKNRFFLSLREDVEKYWSQFWSIFIEKEFVVKLYYFVIWFFAIATKRLIQLILQ